MTTMERRVRHGRGAGLGPSGRGRRTRGGRATTSSSSGGGSSGGGLCLLTLLLIVTVALGPVIGWTGLYLAVIA